MTLIVFVAMNTNPRQTVTEHEAGRTDANGEEPRAWGWWGVAGVGAVAITVRLVYLTETSTVPFLRHLVGDAAGYCDWGRRIAGGQWLGSDTFYQAPLYPYVLACVFRLFGDGTAAVRFLQAIWGAVGAAGLCVAGGRLFGRRTGTIAGVLYALYPAAIFFDGIVQKTSLAGLLVCLLLLGMTDRKCRARAGRMVVLGVVTGALMLVRENAGIWSVVIVSWLAVSRKHMAWTARGAAVGAYLVGMALVLIPVGLRNVSVGGEWSVTTFQMGPNFYIGNHRGADGRYAALVRGHETPAFERCDARRLAEEAAGQRLSAHDVSRYWLHRALREIREEPRAWVRLMAKKVLMVVNRYEVADAESMCVYANQSVLLRALQRVWHFGFLFPLAVMGIVGSLNMRRTLWVYYAMIVSMTGAIALFFVLARYRFILVPPLVLFAAAGCEQVATLVKGRAYRTLIRRGAMVMVVAGVVNLRIQNEACLNALGYMNAGVALAEGNEVTEAMGYFETAVDGCPDSAEARNNLAQALSLHGRFADAVPQYQAALALDPTLMGVEYNLAVALERVGRPAEALRHYRRARELDPGDNEAAAAIVRLRDDP